MSNHKPKKSRSAMPGAHGGTDTEEQVVRYLMPGSEHTIVADGEREMPETGMGAGNSDTGGGMPGGGMGGDDDARRDMPGGGMGGGGGEEGAGGETPRRRTCATMDVHRRLLSSDPGYARARAEIENHARLYEHGIRAAARPGVTRIPVVVHVVWNTAAQNISDAQITSQIDVLNRDYRRTNPDVSSTPAPFLPLTADARVEFFLPLSIPTAHRPRALSAGRRRLLLSPITTP
jgi:hypothetical protein